MSNSNVDEINDVEAFTVVDEVGEGHDTDSALEKETNTDLECIPFEHDVEKDAVASTPEKNDVDESFDCTELNLKQEKEDDANEADSSKSQDVPNSSTTEIDNTQEIEHLSTSEPVETNAEEKEADDDSFLENDENLALRLNKISETENLDESKGDEQDQENEVDTHPYLYLIETFEPPKEQLNFTSVGAVKNLEETTLVIINSKPTLLKMLQTLRTAKEIAIDLQIADKEFKETVCLIEISTKDTDYIIDAIKLKHDLLMLTEVFINPKIVKIVFSANTILSCLQQKLHLFIVNIFDVEKAKSLIMESTQKCWSLANILKDDFSFIRNKKPNADFRKRPLTDDYKKYCRSVTHYLIYIYHDYKNKLLTKDLDMYKKFLDDCREACKKLHCYSKMMLFKGLQDELLNRQKCQLQVLKKLFNWRYGFARKKNLKVEKILTKSVLMYIVKELPTNDDALNNLITSPYAKSELKTIKNLIVETKMTLNVRDNKMNKNKTSKEAKRDANNRKRKLNDQTEPVSKMRRIEGQSNETLQNNSLNKKPIGKFAQNKQNPNKNKNPEKNVSQQKNFNIPSLINNSVQLNKSQSSRHSSGHSFNKRGNSRNRKSSGFDLMHNRHNSNFNRNTPKPLLLNPTNIPSPSTFQSGSNQFDRFGLSHTTFDYTNTDNRMASEDNILQMSIANLEQATANIRRRVSDNEEDVLYRSLIDLKQARDSIRSRSDGYPGDYDSKRYHDLNMIDQKIKTLERRVTQVQGRNTRNVDQPVFGRRY